MTVHPVDQLALQGLRHRLAGDVLLPGDPEYDEARHVFNRMIDKHPAVIARCLGFADVSVAVDFARETGLEVAVRSSGHAVSGSGVIDDGLVIDTSPMKSIEIDTEARVARVGAGVTWGELDAATQEHGLAVTGGRVSSTGVAGLTLGSGSGWLERKLGFTCDNLIAAEIVTSDGQLLRADAERHSDLLWALKGGGGNFGIVTTFEYRLHPVGPIVLGGMVIHPPTAAPQLVRFYRDFMATAPDEIGGGLAFLTAPDAPFVPEPARGKPLVAMILAYAGPVEDGERALAPLREFGPPAMDMVQPMPYTAVQQLIDAGNQPGFNHYWKAEFIDDLTDEAIDTFVPLVMAPSSPLTATILQPLGGAPSRVPDDSTALGRRDAAFAFHALTQWEGDDHERHIEWARNVHRAMAPYTAPGVYLTYSSDEGEERSRAAFGEAKFTRLRAIKDLYDPIDMFKTGAAIRPTGGG
jgi:FAD/FMN-containing dehydrogenase